MKTISKLLVANRGEIACRVMSTARKLGMKTVAVYSDADSEAPHMVMADEAVHIGPSVVSESYLNIDKIIDAARRSGANAIHPGYGFLSENAAFSKACADAGLIFVGPPEIAIAVMGDKARAKRTMIGAGVPCVPGYQGEKQTDKVLTSEAKKIGYPLMVKASAGGGGRGMRLVKSEEGLERAIKLARSEAKNAFGSGQLIIEKAIIRPRHVEIQVFGDQHGNIIHLGERDCSVQRRHQKVIEEAPCPVMTPKLRKQMGDAAIAAARAVDYVGAGTVEFLLGEDGSFYFLEMNTRLQVEHPVTEEITGLDLVALQLKVACGEPLNISQDDVKLIGASIEVRLYAEDPENDFLPSTGPIILWAPPIEDNIRVDDGVASGGYVSPYYDPMVAKIISKGRTRNQARLRLVDALSKTALVGVRHNRDFLIDALKQDCFSEGKATTAFIGETYGDTGFQHHISEDDFIFAGAIIFLQRRDKARLNALGISPELMNWSSSGQLETVFVLSIDGDVKTISVTPMTNDHIRVRCGGNDASDLYVSSKSGARLTLVKDGPKISFIYHLENALTVHVIGPEKQYLVKDISAGGTSKDEAGSGIIIAPTHGAVLEVSVKVGNLVEPGDKLAVLEAMKMQQEILSDVTGKVKSIAVKVGDQTASDDIMMEIQIEEDSKK